jgi:hypothetical protein
MLAPAPVRVILLSVSTALGNVLRGQLQALDDVTVAAVVDPTTYDGPRPALVVFEVTGDTDNLAHRVLLANVSNRLIFIGPVSPSISRQRGLRGVDMRELSADVSVAEVVRICREMLMAQSVPAASLASVGANEVVLTPEPPLPSLPSFTSNPYDLEVVPQATGASLPALPAPLFPVSVSPSTNPSRRPSSGAPAPGPLSDTGDDPEFALEPGLKALLDAAEQRIASELSPRHTSPPEPPDEFFADEPFLLSAEVRAMLAEPVGRYGTLGRAVPHSGSPYSDFATRTGHGNTTHGPGSPSSTGRATTGARSSTGHHVPDPGSERSSEALPNRDVVKRGEVSRADMPTNSDSGIRGESSTSSTEHGKDDLENEPFIGMAPSVPESSVALESNHSATTKPPAPPVSRRALLSPAVPPAPLLPKEHDPRPRPRAGAAPNGNDASKFKETQRNPGAPEPDEVGTGEIEPRWASEVQHTTPVPTAGAHLVKNDVVPTHRPGPRPNGQQVGGNHPGLGATTPSSKQDSDFPSQEPWRSPPHQHTAPPARHSPATEPIQSAPPERTSKRVSDLPPLGSGDTMALVARVIRTRFTGAIVFESDGGIRRIVMRDGDFVTAASGVQTESLLSYLVAQGTLSAAVAHRLEHRLPQFGRHAGAALIAAGHLTQEQLWPCLRAHAEHIIANILKLSGGVANFEEQVPERLANEPAVFGGATGAEVLIELVRRVIAPNEAVRLLGGVSARLSLGTAATLLDECALSRDELEALPRTYDRPLGEALASNRIATLASVLYALCQLKVLKSEADHAAPDATASLALDEQALRELIANRKALVEEADYFELLGVSPQATAYDIGRAYLSLKRMFQPATLLTAGVTDMDDDVRLIATVIEEAYDILRDNTRRERYRKALMSTPG